MTLVTFVFFTALVAVLTWVFTRKADHHTGVGFFLAGRSLTFPFIAGSLLLTNLSTEQMVGLNGDAFTHGLCVMAWEVVAVVALVAMALFFLPRFLKSGVTTVPEFLEMRFDKTTQVLTNLIFLAAYAVILLPIILYTGATGLLDILNVPELTGIHDRRTLLYLIVIVVALIGSVYALWGGLKSVAFSDTLNGIGLYIGGLLITYFALVKLGNGSFMTGLDVLPQEVKPNAFNSIGGPHTTAPFFTLFTGILLINVFYWCTNQQIIQRTFGASSLAEGQKGVLLTGAFKLVGPLFLVLPGIIAYALLKNEVTASNQAYGKLVQLVLPNYLAGFFAAAMLGAILSSFNSALNSTCTLFSLGLYKRLLRPDGTDAEVVKSGRWFGWIITIVAIVIAPMLDNMQNIFQYLQEMNAIYFIPILAVVVVGMLSKRVPAIAANVALVAGVAVIAIGYFMPGIKEYVVQMQKYHFISVVFVLLVAGMYLYGAVRPLKEAWVQYEARAVDMTPWKYAVHIGVLLLVVVAAIYVWFADFSVLQDVPAETPIATQLVE
ncbi:solute:sodium symporter family transporter [Victivallis sp. Marseille-Q1083]|uniref:solute:sodium symporter family transporter n=1 Tax=Victivallis sp. Marseille-Q1083 TaxID=2717288 RepID=UPI001C37A81C|nr:solute:sodium symporter family transporter [Victivallis sp. Marseille-Q1083]